MVSEQIVKDSIPNLKNVYDKSEDNTAIIQFRAGMNQCLSKLCEFETKFSLVIGTNQIYNIIENTRNIILDWAITLEENNILGEGLQFTQQEINIANKTITINNYTNNFFANVNETQIQQDTKDSLQERLKLS